MPPSLSERDARELLCTHCGVLRRRLVFDASRQDGALVKQEWMSLLCLNVTDDELAAGLGYELRVALDIVNALCACAGFSPDRNHRFWRTAVAELWIEYSEDAIDRRRRHCTERLFQPPTHMMLPFDHAAFSCFSIDFQEYPASGFEQTLVELWRQVTWTDAASRCPAWLLERRCAVLSQILGSDRVVRPIRVLRIELIVPSNEARAPTEDEDFPELLVYDWSVLIDALEEIGKTLYDGPRASSLVLNVTSIVQRTPVDRLPSRHELSIAFHPDKQHCFHLHSNNLSAMTRLLCGCRFVKCLTFDVRLIQEAGATDPIALFGELLCVLLMETKTLKTLRILRWATKHVVAAVCSVLPVASSLESLLICGTDGTDDALARQWEWLEYGLSHALRRDARLPELVLAVDETNLDAADAETRLQEMRRSKCPLKPVVRDTISAALGGRDVSYNWYMGGSAVAHVVVQGSVGVYLDPKPQGRPVTQVTEGSALEPVVSVAQLGVVGVVVRGYGLCWVAEGAITIELTPFEAECRSRLLGLMAVSVRSGTWGGNSTPSGLPIARWLNGDTLRSLSLVRLDRTIQHPKLNVLKLILQCCPNLRTLLLELYGVGSLRVLVDAYARAFRPCQVTSLSIVSGSSGVDETKCLPLLKMLSDPSHPGTRLLRHLSLVASQCAHVPEHFRAQDVARMLATNSVLETVYIFDYNYRESKEWNESTRALLEPFQDQVLEDCSGVAIGLLSVAMHYGEHRGGSKEGVGKRTRRFKRCGGVGRLDVVLLRHVLSFVGATRVRCMRWVCDQQNSFPSLTVNRYWKYAWT